MAIELAPLCTMRLTAKPRSRSVLDRPESG
jgi:hypothetical protein